MMTAKEVLSGLVFLAKYAPAQMHGPLQLARAACEKALDDMTLDEIRDRPADDLEVSVACAASLGHLGLKTVRDVEEFVKLPDDVILTRGKKVYFGKKRIKEVRNVLKEIGLFVARREARPG